MAQLVNGIGFKGIDYPSCDGEKMLKEYSLWKSMLLRCTNKCWIKWPSYIGTTCSDNFKNYSYFYEWCNSQIGFGNKDEKGKTWQLDKDLLVRGSKVYSEDTCVFVPARINSLLTKCDSTRGEYPVGVSWREKTGKFKASCQSGDGVLKNLGHYRTVEQAFKAYKTFKEALIKQVAEQYKSQLDYRAYEALLSYQVEITD